MSAHERTPSRRSRRSAKSAGASFERAVANYLNEAISQVRGWPQNIDRRVKTGAKDRGDIAGVQRWAHAEGVWQCIVIECKNTAVLALPQWAREAEVERGNDDALAGVVVHKRHGVADPARQWVTMELSTLVALLTGERPEQVVEGHDTRDAIEALSVDAGRQERAS